MDTQPKAQPGLIVRQLRRALEPHKLSVLSRRSGLGARSLSRLVNDDDANPTADTLEALAEALGKRWVLIDVEVLEGAR